MSDNPKPKRLETSREQFQIVMADRTWKVWTRPFDYTNFERTRARHDWAPRGEDPMRYLLFLAWCASRHAGEIEMSMKYEQFEEAVEDIAQLEPEPLVPTEPAPGAG